MLYQNSIYRIMGDRSLIIEFGDEISPEMNQRVMEFTHTMAANPLESVVETIPPYRSLLIVYDPLKISFNVLKQRIDDLQKKIGEIQTPEPKIIEIPVVYGGEYGPDLEWVARYHKISTEEAISFHTAATYRVYMIGLTPGFPYMGKLSEKLVTPRKETPGTVIPAGSVGIAQRQTGIYPSESPGGWQIIGRTPLKLFNPTQSPPAILKMGDLVRFFQIGKEELEHWKQ